MDALLNKIFDTLYKIEDDSLADMTYTLFCDNDLDEIYKEYCSTTLNNVIIPNMENKNRKIILNLAIYVYKEIVPIFQNIEDIEAYIQDTKEKIMDLKSSLYDKVNDYATKKNYKKYIFKEYKDNIQNQNMEITKFVKNRLAIIKDWVKNKDYILSNFYYAEDLQYSQKKAFIKYEIIYLFLINGGYDIVHSFKDYSLKTIDTVSLNDYLAKVPLIAFIDGLWRPDGLTNESQLETENLITLLPDDETLKRDFKGVILCTKYEMSVFANIILYGQDTLDITNKVTFTISQLTKSLGLSISGTAYERLEYAIRCLKARQLIYRYYDKTAKDWRTREFSLLSSIDYPMYNSKGEKEWTVELDSYIKEQILLAKYKKMNPKDIFDFKLDLSHSLLSVIINDSIKDIEENKFSHEYTLATLSSRTFLTGKPSEKKKKLIASFEEILKMPDVVITRYEVNKDKTRFIDYYKTDKEPIHLKDTNFY